MPNTSQISLQEAGQARGHTSPLNFAGGAFCQTRHQRSKMFENELINTGHHFKKHSLRPHDLLGQCELSAPVLDSAGCSSAEQAQFYPAT